MRDATFLDRLTARRTAQQLRAGRPAVAAPARLTVAAPAARPATVPITAAALGPAPAAQVAAAVATAVAAERDRIRGILEAPEAKGREQSAASMAYSTDFSPTQARQILATLLADADVEVDAAVKQILQHARGPRRGTQAKTRP
jgi:hypothetical protein